jgi:hypothetical protein
VEKKISHRSNSVAPYPDAAYAWIKTTRSRGAAATLPVSLFLPVLASARRSRARPWQPALDSSRPASPCGGLSSSLRTRSSLFRYLPRARKLSARNGVSNFRVELLSCVPVVVSELILSCRSILVIPAASVAVKLVGVGQLADHILTGHRFSICHGTTLLLNLVSNPPWRSSSSSPSSTPPTSSLQK